MSIASDIRSYADSAVSQGKQVLGQAQAQLNDVTGQANDFAGKANEFVSDIAGKASGAVNDLRTSAEKALNLEAIKTAVEPYLTQVKSYTAGVTDKAEELFYGVKRDERVAKLVDTAGSVTGAVLETVQDRVVKPVQSLTGRGGKPVASAPKAAAKPAVSKPAVTKPAPAKPAGRPAARKSAAKRTDA
jgi:ABC-type transporter Mla subunit MlaD